MMYRNTSNNILPHGCKPWPGRIFANPLNFFLWPLIHIGLFLFLFRGILYGVKTTISAGDSINQSFMWLSKVFMAVQSGNVVLWDFTTMSGVSFIGEMQTSPLYPLALLAGMAAGPELYHTFDKFLLIHYLIAAIGMHLYCRQIGFSKWGGFFAAIIFAYGSTFSLRISGQPNLFAGLAWVPYIAWGVGVSVSNQTQFGRIAGAIGAGMALSMSILAGHAHATVLGIIISAVMALSAIPGFTKSGITPFIKKSLFAVLILGLVSFMISCPQLVASSEYLKLTYKWYGPGFTQFPHIIPISFFTASSIHISDFSTLFTGDEVNALDGGTLFITITGLVLAMVAVISIMTGNGARRKIIIPAIAVCAVGISFAFSQLTFFSYLYSNIPIINLIRQPARGLFAFAFGCSILSGAGVDALRSFASEKLSRLPKKYTQIIVWCLSVSLAFILIYEVQHWLVKRVEKPVTGENSALALTLENKALKALLKISEDETPVYRYFAQSDVVPPNIGNYHPLLLSAHGHRSSRTMAYHNYFDFNPQSPRMDKLGVRWWFSEKPIPNFPLIARGDKWFLYERPSSLPIFWIASPDDGNAIPDFKVVDWSVNEVKVQFATPVVGRLVFGQTYFPGFVAYADGLPVDVKVHNELMAIDIPSPSSEVVFRYLPSWWIPTLIIMLAGSCISMLAFLFCIFRRQKRNNNKFLNYILFSAPGRK